MREKFELCSFEYGEPVDLLQVWCDVSVAWENGSDPGCRVLNGLQPSGVEGVPVVQLACDEGMRDVF